MKKINLAITGCMGRMGKQIIKSAHSNKNFKIIALTESKKINRKINGVKIALNTEQIFKRTNIIIDFTIPKCTLQVLDIASRLRKKSGHRNNRVYKKRREQDKRVFKKDTNFKSWKYEFRY